jgi:hypothetical protein
MRSQPGSTRADGRTKCLVIAKAPFGAIRAPRKHRERDPFLQVQAESGRRMRSLIAEHYGDIE